MAYPGRVRIADRKDEEELMGLCRQLHNENALFKINEDKVRTMLRRAFNREGGILGVIGEPGKVEGMIYMLVSNFWYSDDPHLEELWAYVVPAYRKSKNAIELMDFAKWCSDQSGFPLIIGVISNERTAGKVRLYQRQFQSPIGNFFFYKGSPAKVA
jgi:hypothetical protein